MRTTAGAQSATYTVHAVRWEGGWELHVDGVGVTQVAQLSKAAQQVRNYLETEFEVDTIDAHLNFDFELPDGLHSEVKKAKESADAAAKAQAEAAAMTRQAVNDLKRRGVSQSDIAVVMGVSKARVSQLLHSS